MKNFGGYPTVYGLVPLFYLENEQNVPTFFAGILLFFSATILAVIAALKKSSHDPDAMRWMILAFGFLYMAGDELLTFHEGLMRPVRRLMPNLATGAFHFSWVIPLIAVVLLLFVYYLGFLRRLPARSRFIFMLSATLYVGGAIGGELLEGFYISTYEYNEFVFSMLATAEESLEMAGMITFIYGLLDYLAANFREVRFLVDDSRPADRPRP